MNANEIMTEPVRPDELTAIEGGVWFGGCIPEPGPKLPPPPPPPPPHEIVL